MVKEKIIFFGTSEIAVPSLQALIANKFNVVAVATQPDKPQGRKQELSPSPIKKVALENNLALIQTKKISINDLEKYSADLGILFSYGQIVDNNILDYFKFGIINIHPSLLPKYRGPSPIQAALLNQDQQCGVSLMKLVSELDAGPILVQEFLKINDNDDNMSLSKKSADLGADLLIKCIKPYIRGEMILKPQNKAFISYSKMILKEDGLVNVNDDPDQIIQKLKAYKPWPGVYFVIDNKRYKIKQAHLEHDQLVIDIIQPEGKKDMNWDEFKRGYQALLPHFFGSIKT